MTVLKHELRQYIYTPVLAIFLAGFLFFLAASIFLIGNFLDTNHAVLSLQWQFLPWVCVIFIPALAMRAFDNQVQSGSIDLTLSFPLPGYAIVLGKWLSGVVVLALSLVLTFPFLITLGMLGDPDWGIAATGYAGALITLALFHAIAILAAAICKEQIGAFLLAVTFILCLILIDIGVLQNRLIPEALQEIGSYLYSASPKHWLDEMASGRIDLASLGYFGVFIILALALACYQFNAFRKPPARPGLFAASGIGGLIVAASASAVVANMLTTIDIALDATEHKEFTFRQQTLDLAGEVSTGMELTLYISDDLTPAPPQIVQHAERVQRMMRRLADASRGKIKFRVMPLKPDTETAERAELDGIRKVPMTSGDILYFGAGFKAGDRHLVTSYFDYQRAAMLEYDIALQISNLSRDRITRVGILSSLLKPSNVTEPHPGLSILEELKSQYDITIIPYFADQLPDDIDVLVVMDAPVLKKDMLVSIDRHITSGKGALLMLDPYQRMSRANASLDVEPSPPGQINTLGDLLAGYGLQFSASRIVGDIDNSAMVESSTGQTYPYPYWLRLRGENISRQNIISSQLNELLFAEAGFFEVTRDSLNVEPVLVTGPETALTPRQTFRDEGTEYLAATFDPQAMGPRMIAGLITGNVSSPFEGAQSAGGDADASVFAIADVDWIYNGFSLTDAQLGDRVFSRPINDNFNLFLNMVEQLSGDPRLLEIRSRGNPVRTFETIETMLVESRQAYQERETEYMAKINQAESSIAQVLAMTGVETYDQLPDDIKIEVIKLKALTYPIKQDLRDLRLKIREEITSRFKVITLFNLFTGPVLVFLFLFAARSARRISHRP